MFMQHYCFLNVTNAGTPCKEGTDPKGVNGVKGASALALSHLSSGSFPSSTCFLLALASHTSLALLFLQCDAAFCLQDGLWYTAVGGQLDCSGSAMLFSSPPGFVNWTYAGLLASQVGSDSTAECRPSAANTEGCDQAGAGCRSWECPDFFTVPGLVGRHALKWSDQVGCCLCQSFRVYIGCNYKQPFHSIYAAGAGFDMLGLVVFGCRALDMFATLSESVPHTPPDGAMAVFNCRFMQGMHRTTSIDAMKEFAACICPTLQRLKHKLLASDTSLSLAGEGCLCPSGWDASVHVNQSLPPGALASWLVIACSRSEC